MSLGRSIDEEETNKLVSRFISLMVASELSKPLRVVPPPYIGEGPHQKCYASFSCCAINFDPQRLVEAMSGHMARDIIKTLFANKDVKLEETEWPEKIGRWFEKSLTERLTSPANIKLADIRSDPDFLKARIQLDELAQNACRSFGNNFDACQRMIDNFLRQGTVHLESAWETSRQEEEINAIEVKMLLGQNCGEKRESFTKEFQDKPWPLIITLGLVGLGLIIGILFISNLQLEPLHIAGLFIALVPIVVAVILAVVGRKRVEVLYRTVPVSCETELKKLRAEYSEQNKRLKIHVALFTEHGPRSR